MPNATTVRYHGIFMSHFGIPAPMYAFNHETKALGTMCLSCLFSHRLLTSVIVVLRLIRLSRVFSCSQGSTAALNSLDFLGRPDRATEADGQLVTVEEHALRWLDRRQGSSSRAAIASLSKASYGVPQGTILLGSLAVLAEGHVGSAICEVCWERVGWRRGVRLRGVIDSGCQQSSWLARVALARRRSVCTL